MCNKVKMNIENFVDNFPTMLKREIESKKKIDGTLEKMAAFEKKIPKDLPQRASFIKKYEDAIENLYVKFIEDSIKERYSLLKNPSKSPLDFLLGLNTNWELVIKPRDEIEKDTKGTSTTLWKYFPLFASEDFRNYTDYPKNGAIERASWYNGRWGHVNTYIKTPAITQEILFQIEKTNKIYRKIVSQAHKKGKLGELCSILDIKDKIDLHFSIRFIPKLKNLEWGSGKSLIKDLKRQDDLLKEIPYILTFSTDYLKSYFVTQIKHN